MTSKFTTGVVGSTMIAGAMASAIALAGPADAAPRGCNQVNSARISADAERVKCSVIATPPTRATPFVGKDRYAEVVSKFPRAHTWLSKQWDSCGGLKITVGCK